MDFTTLLRSNIKDFITDTSHQLNPTAEPNIFLDANESPYDLEFTRYPDRKQSKLKFALSSWKAVKPTNIVLGNGSEEIVDLLIRAFCEPKIDKVLVLDPSIELYRHRCAINNVELQKLKLDQEFRFETKGLLEFVCGTTKIIFLCNPNNPSGSSISLSEIQLICSKFNGIVVVDEAYIEFSNQESSLALLEKNKNLFVLQTFSTGLAAAGLRLAIGFASEALIDILNAICLRYSINQLSQEAALMRMAELEDVTMLVKEIKINRAILISELGKFSFVEKVFPSDANFILVRVDDAYTVFNFLSLNGILVSNRTHEHACDNCLRITVGNPAENQKLLNVLSEYSK